MAPQRGREERLLDILHNEATKMGRAKPRAPPRFRETALDTHAVAPTDNFGAAWANATATAQKYGSATIAANTVTALQKQRNRRKPSKTRDATLADQIVEFRSVFQPKPEQEHVCKLAKTHRERIANSEWALVDTLEVEMFLSDRDARLRREKQQQAAYRRDLDVQMAQQCTLKADEAAVVQLEKKVLEEELERYSRDQAIKLQNQKQRNIALRNERQAMLVEAEQAKATALKAKRAEEAAELGQVMAQLEQEKKAAAAKTAAANAAMQQFKRDNEARIAAKKASEAAQRATDEALMQQTIATLEKQEHEREEKLKAFMDATHARADRAGQQAVIENRERQEREARLILQAEQQKEAEYQAKQQAAALTKEQQKQALQEARKQELQARAEKQAQAKAQVVADREAAETLASAEAAAHERKMSGIRARSKAHQEFLRTQMAEREQTSVDCDVGMSPLERQLNGRLLNHATKIVGQPKQYTVRLY